MRLKICGVNKDDKNFCYMNWKYWLILIISVIILIIAPGLFTQTAIFDFWKFDTVTGSVGDTIGGTTAPIVGLISIFSSCCYLMGTEEI